MDPNVALSTIRDRIATWMGPAVPDSQMELADEIINLVDDLDDWLSKGGFPPQAWIFPPTPPQTENVHKHGGRVPVTDEMMTTPGSDAPLVWHSPEGAEYGNPAVFLARRWAIGPEAIKRAVRHRSGQTLYPLYPEQMIARDARGVDRLVTFDEPLKVDTATANPLDDPSVSYTWTSRRGELFANAVWFYRRGESPPAQSVRSRTGVSLYAVPDHLRNAPDLGEVKRILTVRFEPSHEDDYRVRTVPPPSDPAEDQHSSHDGQDSDTVPTLRPDDPAPPLTPGSVGRPAFPPSWTAEAFTLECIDALTSALRRLAVSHPHTDQRRRWERHLQWLDEAIRQAVARYAPETPGSS